MLIPAFILWIFKKNVVGEKLTDEEMIDEFDERISNSENLSAYTEITDDYY